MNEKQRAQWERTRAKGMWHFVLVYGVLFWGGIMSFAMAVVSRTYLGIRIPIYLASGFVFGMVCWLVSEHFYRKGSGNASSS